MNTMPAPLTCILVDDEPGNIITLSELLREYCPEIAIVDTAQDIKKAYDSIKLNRPDVVFLDIEMPYGTAFDLLDKFGIVEFEVVFITAFNDYAIRAFKYAALDYLLKPVNIAELKEAVKKVTKRMEEKKVNLRISSLLANLRSENQLNQKIGLPTSEGFYFEEVNNLMHLEASGSYTQLFIKGRKKLLVSKNLKEFEEILPDSSFCRVHHSHIININFVKKYFKGRGGYVEMEDGTTIEIAVRKKDDFFARFRH